MQNFYANYDENKKAVVSAKGFTIPERNLLVEGGAIAVGGAISANAICYFAGAAVLGPVGVVGFSVFSLPAYLWNEWTVTQEVRKQTDQIRNFLLENVGCPTGWSFKFVILDQSGKIEMPYAKAGYIGQIECIAPKRDLPKFVLQDKCLATRFYKEIDCVKNKIAAYGKTKEDHKNVCKKEVQDWLKTQSETKNLHEAEVYHDKFMMDCHTEKIITLTGEINHSEL